MFFAAIAIVLVLMWAWMKRNPAVAAIHNTEAPLPSGLYTSGNANNGMDTRLRKNFQQQPYGGPTTG
jgi:hypothetical protein